MAGADGWMGIGMGGCSGDSGEEGMMQRITIILLVTAALLVVANSIQLVMLLEANRRAQALIERLEAQQ